MSNVGEPEEKVTAEDMIPEDIDEELTEDEALKQAAAQGIYFRDFYTFEGAEKEYETKEAAEKDADGKDILQQRVRTDAPDERS